MVPRILLLLTIFLHCIAFGIFALCVYSGPPMGESEFSPWDLGIIVSSVLGFILLPLLYIPILRRRTVQPGKFLCSSISCLLVVAGVFELFVILKTFSL